jgi:hypothetical protein
MAMICSQKPLEARAREVLFEQKCVALRKRQQRCCCRWSRGAARVTAVAAALGPRGLGPVGSTYSSAAAS